MHFNQCYNLVYYFILYGVHVYACVAFKEKSMVLWILLLAVSISLFVFVEVFVLPKMLFQHNYAVRKIKDRGIKTEQRGDEEIIVYEPDLLMRKHVHQYMLIKRQKGKFLMCKIDEGLAYLEYEVVVYGKNNRILTILNVKDRIKRAGFTEELELPQETAFVSVLVSEVDRKRFVNNLFAPIKSGKVVLYSVLSFFAIITLAFVVRISIAFILGGIFRESVLLSSEGNIITALVALGLGILNLIVASLCIKKRNKEIKR